MNGVRVALDTTIAVHFLNNVEPVVTRFREEPIIALPAITAGELFYGALNSSRRAVNLERYEQLIADSLVPPVDRDTARRYAELRLALKRLGKPIPENDLWIAAICLQHGLVLAATADEHFGVCPGLATENWLRP